jgi:hypothetical protein
MKGKIKMSATPTFTQASPSTPAFEPHRLYKIAAVSALLELVVILVYFVVLAVLGNLPADLEARYMLMSSDPLSGLLRGDLFNLLIVGLYLGLLPGLYLALRRVAPTAMLYAAGFILIAVVLGFATNPDFSLLHLSRVYAQATTAAQRAQLLAAGQAILAADLWHSSGAYIAGLFLQGSGVLISLVMLRAKGFSKVTAWAGLLANSLDLVQHLLHPFTPSISEVILLVAGPFYLAWFPMLARDFIRQVKAMTVNGPVSASEK